MNVIVVMTLAVWSKYSCDVIVSEKPPIVYDERSALRDLLVKKLAKYRE